MKEQLEELVDKRTWGIVEAVVSGLLLALIFGIISVYSDVLSIKDWIHNHDNTKVPYHEREFAAFQKEVRADLSEMKAIINELVANKNVGGRWSYEMQQTYSMGIDKRLDNLESENRVVRYELTSINKKLDKLLENKRP